MPRYYRDKIYTNRYQKKQIQLAKIAFTEKLGHPPPTAWDHEKLMTKLNRKIK